MLVEAGSSHTDWSMVAQAGQDDEQARATALERLVRRYWPAVFAYIRSTGRDFHSAADLTQGFVCDVIISRRLCAVADPTRGRFRALLLAALKTYLRERHRHDTRKRRAGNLWAASMPIEVTEPGPDRTPDQAFSRQWSATLVRRVLDRVRAGCLADGLDAHWEVFEQRVVRPMLFDDQPADYAGLVERLGLKDTTQAANMMVTVKRRFASTLSDEVGQTVADPDQIDDEIGVILRDLERPS